MATHLATDASRVWLPDLVQRYAACMSPNDIACTLRRVDKATAALFPAPRYVMVSLSQPVPPHAFARHWSSPEALTVLTLKQRQELLCLTARSGSIHNLEMLETLQDYFMPLREDVLASASGAGHIDVCVWLRQRGCPLAGEQLEAAAGAGHLEVCAWLRQEGCPWGRMTLELAARGGHRAVCEWLLASDCPWSDKAPAKAAAGGHVGLMDWLLRQRRDPRGIDFQELLEGTASGCDLATLQRMYGERVAAAGDQQHQHQQQQEGMAAHSSAILDAAAGSPTPDWQAKVEWLLGKGYTWPAAYIRARFMQHGDWRARLDWLLQRGLPAEGLMGLPREAAAAGDAVALRDMFAAGVRLVGLGSIFCALEAARGGHLSALEVLYAHRDGENGICSSLGSPVVAAAARNGSVHILAWLLERIGSAAVLMPGTFQFALEAGRVAPLTWLRERGCPWGEDTFATAAASGCEAQLAWMAEQGCPMGDDGAAYVSACRNCDLPTLRCLRRLGCPLPTREGDVFLHAVRCIRFGRWSRRRALRWLLQQGCAVDWEAAERDALGKSSLPELLADVLALRREAGSAPAVGLQGAERAAELGVEAHDHGHTQPSGDGGSGGADGADRVRLD